MPMPPVEVTPLAPASAPPAPQVDPSAPEAPAPTEDSKSGQSTDGIPPAILQIPAMQAILAGKPAAVSAPLAEFEKRPEAKALLDNKDALLKAGFGLYRSLSGEVGVVFNSFHIHPQELKAADQAGKLQQIAPPFDAVNDAVGKAGLNDHPVLQANEVPIGPKGPPMPTPPQLNSPMGSPVPASVQRKAMTARLNNLTPGGPTSGPQPGGGRLLNSILTQPV